MTRTVLLDNMRVASASLRHSPARPGRASLALTGLLVGGLLAPSHVGAYFVETRSNDMAGMPIPVAYDTATDVEFRIDMAGMPGGDGSEVAAIAAAFQTWSDVECSTINFVQGARETDPQPRHWMNGPDRYILVYWLDDATFWDVPRVGFFDWAHDGTGVLIGGQIILNATDHEWSTAADGEPGKMDVQGVVTALVGRVLGITSNMMMNATYPSYEAADTSKRTLGADDIAAIQFIYGDMCTTPPPDPEALCDMATPDCPPEVVTMPGDGGTAMPDSGITIPTDAGPPPGGDAGTTPPGDDDGGCSCRAVTGTGSSAPALAVALVLGLLLSWRRRR